MTPLLPDSGLRNPRRVERQLLAWAGVAGASIGTVLRGASLWQARLTWHLQLTQFADPRAGTLPQNFLHTCRPPIIHRDLKSPNLVSRRLGLPACLGWQSGEQGGLHDASRMQQCCQQRSHAWLPLLPAASGQGPHCQGEGGCRMVGGSRFEASAACWPTFRRVWLLLLTRTHLGTPAVCPPSNPTPRSLFSFPFPGPGMRLWAVAGAAVHHAEHEEPGGHARVDCARSAHSTLRPPPQPCCIRSCAFPCPSAA